MRRLVIAGVLLFGSAPAAQAQILWSLLPDSTATDGSGALLYGLDSRRWSGSPAPPSNPFYSDAKVASGGPVGGHSSVRLTMLGHTGQIYAGGNVAVAAPNWGQSYFHRGRIKLTYSDTDPHTLKHIIIADSATDNRPIMTIGTHFAEPLACQLRLQMDGGVSRIDSAAFAKDTWQSYQFEVFPGSAPGANDGYYKFWVGTFTYASPLGTTSGVAFTNTQRLAQGELSLGYFFNDDIDAADAMTVEIADYEIGTTFDTAWATGGGGGGSSPKYRIRFR